jgi:hypothetical protein
MGQELSDMQMVFVNKTNIGNKKVPNLKNKKYILTNAANAWIVLPHDETEFHIRTKHSEDELHTQVKELKNITKETTIKNNELINNLDQQSKLNNELCMHVNELKNTNTNLTQTILNHNCKSNKTELQLQIKELNENMLNHKKKLSIDMEHYHELAYRRMSYCSADPVSTGCINATYNELNKLDYLLKRHDVPINYNVRQISLYD